MAKFSVNPHRFDPYKNFKFRVKWDGRTVAGVSKISALKRTTEVVEHREGSDPSTTRKSPGQTTFAPIVLERGLTHDTESAVDEERLGARRSLVDRQDDVRLLSDLAHAITLSGSIWVDLASSAAS